MGLLVFVFVFSSVFVFVFAYVFLFLFLIPSAYWLVFTHRPYTRRLQSADIDTNTEETAATNVAKDKNTDKNIKKKKHSF